MTLLGHRVDGDGEPLLLLNGGMMTAASWEPIAEKLGDHHQLIRCDFRGQLLSLGVHHGDLDAHVADVLELLDAIGAGEVDVLGMSFGAEVGLLMAALAPERVRSLIAVTATDHATESIHRGAESLRPIVARVLRGEGGHGDFYDTLVEDVHSPDWIATHRAEIAARRAQMPRMPEAWFEGIASLLDCTEAIDLRPHLDRIRCPALVVIAGDDKVMPPERSRALAAAIGAEVEELPGSGHAVIVEHPDWLVERCLAFLGRSRT